jgi:hypothetical protein
MAMFMLAVDLKVRLAKFLINSLMICFSVGRWINSVSRPIMKNAVNASFMLTVVVAVRSRIVSLVLGSQSIHSVGKIKTKKI